MHTSETASAQRTGIVWALRAGLLLVALLLFVPMMWHWSFVTPSDFDTHNNVLVPQLITMPGEFFANTPHFVYHVLVAALVVTLEISPNAAGAAVMVGTYLGLLAVVYVTLRRAAAGTITGRAAAGGFALALLLIAPINIFTPDNLYFGYFTPHVYHNPTVNMMKPFAVALFVAAVRLYLPKERLPAWWAIPYALLTAACLFSKPNFILMLIPALALLTAFYMLRSLWNDIRGGVAWSRALLRMWTQPPVNWSVLIGGIVIPAAVILGVQTLTWTSSGGIGIAPLLTYREWARFFEPAADDLLAFKLVMSVVFPLAVTLLHPVRASRSLRLNLAWLLAVIGFAMAYLLVDYTKIDAGDFGWGAQVGVLVLHLAAAAFFLRIYRPLLRGTDVAWQSWLAAGVCLLIFALHLISGIHWYNVHLHYDALQVLNGVW